MRSTRSFDERDLYENYVSAVNELGMYGYDLEGNVKGTFYQEFGRWLGSRYPVIYDRNYRGMYDQVRRELEGLEMPAGVASVVAAETMHGISQMEGERVNDLFVQGSVIADVEGGVLPMYEMVLVYNPTGEEELRKDYWEGRYAMRYRNGLYWADVAGWDVHGRPLYVVLEEFGGREATSVPGAETYGGKLPDVWEFNSGWNDQSEVWGGNEIRIHLDARAEFSDMLYRIPEGYYLVQPGKGVEAVEEVEKGRMIDEDLIGVEPRYSIESAS